MLGIILLILGFAGLLALGIAGSFFDTIYSSNGQEYRYLSAMLRTNDFLLLLFILAIVSALTGAIVLLRQIFRKKLDKFSAMQSEIRAMREKEAEKQRRELYNSAKSEISSAFKNEAKKNSENRNYGSSEFSSPASTYRLSHSRCASTSRLIAFSVSRIRCRYISL